MVMLAAAVSLRLFRFGGVQKMALAGVIAGFLLYVMSKICGDLSKAGMMPPLMAAALPTLHWRAYRADDAPLSGGWLVTAPAGTSALWLRRPVWGGASCAVAMVAMVTASLIDARTTSAQQRQIISFPTRPKGPTQPGRSLLTKPAPQAPGEQREPMLVRADEINYDYANERVAAVGNVQIYRGGSTLEADRVIYDQKTKRLHAEGNIRLTEPDGKVTYGDIIDLSDDYRDGFIESLRLETPEQVRMAGNRADRTAGNFTVLQSGVYNSPANPARTIPRSPRNGRSRPPGSFTIRASR